MDQVPDVAARQTLRVALVGAPNCGKSTLFNGLTGGRAKVANYPGATVELRTGGMTTPDGRRTEIIDLPGIYGLAARSADERVALKALQSGLADGHRPDLLLVLIDAVSLRTHLHTILQMLSLNLPTIVVLNMMDLARRDGLEIDVAALERELGVPVVACQATRAAGRAALLTRIDEVLAGPLEAVGQGPAQPLDLTRLKAMQRDARAMASRVITGEPTLNKVTRAIDSVVLHPLLGLAILATLLFLVFQAVFAWAAWPMEQIEAGVAALGSLVGATLPEGWLHDLIVDGIIAGVGSVLVFLPQILILFSFILLLEASGYMSRAAFLMDELMRRVGLNGRAFIPLLSSFACAIPGVMAARTIDNEKDRLTTIMIAPLMTCSARLPVYTLMIAAFIRPDKVGPFNQQGLVMFGLYLLGIISAVVIAWVLKHSLTKGPSQPLIMELPSYKWPNLRDFGLGLYDRALAFLKRAGTLILSVSIILWFLVSYPSSATTLAQSFAGRLGALLEPLLAPIGFNLEIAIALVPGLAAREVAVGALGTIYAVQGGEENIAGLAATLQSAWSLPTALAFLVWFVFAPQCLATIATVRRETNSWGWAAFLFGYLMAVAYIAAGLTYWGARAVGL